MPSNVVGKMHANSLPCHWDDAGGHASFEFGWCCPIHGGKEKGFDKTGHMVICQAGPMSIIEFGVLES